MTGALYTLLTAAARAPSGDNTQPWRWDVDAAEGRLTLRLDPARDPSPMNAGQRMARVALGAALENVERTARHNGWDLEAEPADPPALAALRLRGPDAPAGRVEPAVTARVTNRRPYDGRPVPDDVRASLEEDTPQRNGVRTCWVHDPGRRAELAGLVGAADAVMFGEPSMRRAFLANVRFDAPPAAEVSEGLSLASLELSAADRIALRLMARLPNWVVRGSGSLRVFAAHAHRLVASAAGLCLVVAPDDRAETDLAVGRAAQRAWLALTARALAAQPMMSLPVLDNARHHGSPALIASLGRAGLERLPSALREQVPEIGPGRLAFLLRFGYAPPPSGRTGRLPLAAVASAVDAEVIRL